jgi:hypothetical protein
MPTAPTLVGASVVTINSGASGTTPTLGPFQVGDVVHILAGNEGNTNGDAISSVTTTFTNGGIAPLQNHAAASNCGAAAYTFTITAVGSGTVTVTQTGALLHMDAVILVHRGGVGATVTRSAIQMGSSRTLAYTASQADSALAWAVFDWAAAATVAATPTATTHTTSTPGPSALPAAAAVNPNYTYYDELLDDQTSTASTGYGIGGTGTGPFTIVVVEIQGTGGGSTPNPFHPKPASRAPIFRASTF